MRLRPLALCALLAVAALAGCTAPPAATPTTTAAPVITDPRDTSYLRNATYGSHAHDYWQGSDTLTVVDADSGTGSSRCSGQCDEMGIGFFRPEKGHIVPQGAAWVNVTVHLAEDADGNAHGTPQLWVKTAQDAEPRKLGDLQDNVPFSIATTNDMDDPPHYVLSLWRFEVRVPPAAGASDVSFSGHLTLRAVAQRGLPLVVYGPHPDQWNGATEAPLLAQDLKVTLEYQVETDGGRSTSCYGGCLGTLPVDDGRVVPFDATAVVVTLTFQPGALPAGVALVYHGADTWDASKATPEPGGTPTTLTFRVPVGDHLPDSPYAKQSLWEFGLVLDQPAPVRAWEGEVHVEAKAVKA